MGGWVDGLVDGWMGGWVDGWVDGWRTGNVFSFFVFIFFYIVEN